MGSSLADLLLPRLRDLVVVGVSSGGVLAPLVSSGVFGRPPPPRINQPADDGKQGVARRVVFMGPLHRDLSLEHEHSFRNWILKHCKEVEELEVSKDIIDNQQALKDAMQPSGPLANLQRLVFLTRDGLPVEMEHDVDTAMAVTDDDPLEILTREPAAKKGS